MNDLEILVIIILTFLALSIANLIYSIVCYYKIFKKAGKEGWEIFIPIYNIVVLTEISGLSMWYLLFIVIPGIGMWIFFIMLYVELSKRFGKSTGFAMGLLFLNPIFIGILAFNKNIVYGKSNTITNNSSQQSFNSICKRCGAPINIDDKFCMNCGNQI